MNKHTYVVVGTVFPLLLISVWIKDAGGQKCEKVGCTVAHGVKKEDSCFSVYKPGDGQTYTASTPLAIVPVSAGSNRFTHRFGSDPFNERVMRYVGPHVAEAITESRRGLEINLPVDRPGRPQVGVATNFAVAGDFEITAGYELLDVPTPERGYGAGVMIRLFRREGHYRRVTHSRFHMPNGDHVYDTNIWNSVGEELNPERQLIPAETDRGQLRLVRTGSTLTYLVAEGDDQEFREVRRVEDFGSDPWRWIELFGDTGGCEQPISVLLTELSISADELPFGMPEAQRRRIWGVWTFFGLLGVIIVTISGLWYWRQRVRSSSL